MAKAVVACGGPPQRALPTPTPTPMWIDTDAGVDDAHALLLAACSAAAEIRAISLVRGNVGVSQAHVNVVRSLLACHPASAAHGAQGISTPIYAGADVPLVAHPREPSGFYGRDGLGDVPDMAPTPQHAQAACPAPSTGIAAVKLLECAEATQGELVVVALGPLTNIALALALQPRLPQQLRALYVLGASEGAGNVMPTAEFNFHLDPEAAAVVMSRWSSTPGACPCYLVDWQACLAHLLPWHVMEAIQALPTQRAAFFAGMLSRLGPKMRADSPSGLLLGDPLAVAAALFGPQLVRASVPVQCQVELTGGLTRGMSVMQRRGALRLGMDPLEEEQAAAAGAGTGGSGSGSLRSPAGITLITEMDMAFLSEQLLLLLGTEE